MAEKSKQVRLDASKMFPIMELFEESGMTQKQFCLEMDLVPHTFTYWLGKYRKSKRPTHKLVSNNEFVALNIDSGREGAIHDRMIRITYPGGIVIELPI